METIRILFYTDHENIVDRDGPTGLSDLMRFIVHNAKELYRLELVALNRHISLVTNSPAQGANKLSWGLLSNFDELWVFGKKQINFPSDDIAKAEPYNELDEHEIRALKKWMDSGGGLMVTGDHSEPNRTIPSQECDEPGHGSFLTLGRALGRKMPRAHQLRTWEGPPTFCTSGPLALDNLNTQELGSCDPSLDSSCHQEDEIPQTLLNLQPRHQLFSYVNSRNELVPIEVLPDHMHEGKVLVPAKLDDTWPTASVFPVVAAKGVDKRKFDPVREYDLVIAYDGDASNVGRIVADSSFHHFINKNLASLLIRELGGTPVPDSPLDQISHYFSNLVVWLAPKSKRDKMIDDLPFRLAKHYDVLEARGSGTRELGRTARSVAAFEFGKSNLFQLFPRLDLETNRISNPISMAFFEENIPAEFSGVESADLLGAIVKEYHEVFRREEIHSPGFLDENPTTHQVIDNALFKTLGAHPAWENLMLSRTEEEKTIMAEKCSGSTWKSYVNRDPVGDPNDGRFDTGPIINADGDFGGRHRLGTVRPIIGNCKENPEHRIVIHTLTHTYRGKITNGITGDVVLRSDGRRRPHLAVVFPAAFTEADWDFTNPVAPQEEEWAAEKET